MRIGQFTETFLPIVDGVGRVVYSYADTLSRKGHEVYVVAPMMDLGYRGGLPFDIVDYHGVPVLGSPQYRAGVAPFDNHYLQRVNKIDFDVIHSHSPFTAGYEAIRLADKCGCPLIGTFHSNYYDDFYKATHAELVATLGVKLVADFYKRCDEVWAVSNGGADALHEYGYKGDIRVMQNGTDIRAIRPECLEKAKREWSELRTDKPVLLFVGQMNWKKDIRLILEASALMHSKGLDHELVLVGQGPDAEAIHHKADELGILGSTLFTGHIHDQELLDGLYQAADLFVFPSRYDSSPMVLREAAVMAVPAVLSIGSAPSEVIDSGKNGLLADPDSDSLERVIENALSDRTGLAKLGMTARETIPVSWDTVLDGVVAHYERLIRE